MDILLASPLGGTGISDTKFLSESSGHGLEYVSDSAMRVREGDETYWGEAGARFIKLA